MTSGRNTRTRHFGRLVSGAFQFSQKEQEPMFVGTFEIISDAGKEKNAVNVPPATKVRWWASLSEATWRTGTPKIDATIDGLRACGWNGTKIADVPLLLQDGELDRQVFLTVEHYQGKMKVAFVDESRGSGGGNEDMTADQLAAVSARLEAVVASLKPRSERKAAAKQPPPDDMDGPPPGEPYGPADDFPL